MARNDKRIKKIALMSAGVLQEWSKPESTTTVENVRQTNQQLDTLFRRCGWCFYFVSRSCLCLQPYKLRMKEVPAANTWLASAPRASHEHHPRHSRDPSTPCSLAPSTLSKKDRIALPTCSCSSKNPSWPSFERTTTSSEFGRWRTSSCCSLSG